MSVLLCYSLKLDEGAHRSNRHSFDHFHAAGESRLCTLVGLTVDLIPNLTIGTVTVPTKVSIGNCFKGEELEAAQQPVLFGHVHALAQDFNFDELLVRVEQIVIAGGRRELLASLLTHEPQYSNKQCAVSSEQ